MYKNPHQLDALDNLDHQIAATTCAKEAGMDVGNEELKLGENIAAVRLGESVAGENITGVAVIIPSGEIVQLNRTAPSVAGMLEIEWNGAKYGVFPDDLRRRSGKLKSSGAPGAV